MEGPTRSPDPSRPQRFLTAISEKMRDYRSRGSIVVVAFGDSVTMGCTQPGKLEPAAVYHHRLKGMLEARYPQAVFSVVNSGIGGETAGAALARLERDVIVHRPALVLVAFGLNDASSEPSKLEEFRLNLRQIIARIRQDCDCDVILLTPSFMCSRDSEAVALEHRPLVGHMLQMQREGHLARYAAAIREVASENTVPVADIYAAWQKLADAGVDTTAMLANGLNHPTAEAHQIAAAEIMAVIDPDGMQG